MEGLICFVNLNCRAFKTEMDHVKETQELKTESEECYQLRGDTCPHTLTLCQEYLVMSEDIFSGHNWREVVVASSG